MNKRYEKKIYENTLIKIKKLHPQKGDVICLQFNPNCIDLYTISEYFKAYNKSGVLGDAKAILVPTSIKEWGKKELQSYINKLQDIINEMGE